MALNDANEAVEVAYKAFQTYRHVSPRVRSQRLLKWRVLINEHRDDLAQIITLETGKLLSEAYGEVDYAISFTHWFAGEADRIQGTVFRPALNGRRVFTIKEPVGVVAALTPWNFPFAYVPIKETEAASS
jgi:succinate-semialdehyde dehydrogenase/glutarate-semialdehyde dehydrogenase